MNLYCRHPQMRLQTKGTTRLLRYFSDVFFSFTSGCLCLSLVIGAFAVSPVVVAQVTESEQPQSEVAADEQMLQSENTSEEQQQIAASAELTEEADDTERSTQEEEKPDFPTGTSLEQIHSLIELRAVQLAYALLQDARPDYEDSEYSEDWVDWEMLYYQLALQTEDWNGIIQRTEEIANTVPYEFYAVMQSYAVKAEFGLGQYENARKRLRRMIWELPYELERIIEWRELIAESYVADSLLEDAEIALTSFNRDYRPSGPDWEHRYIRILFLTGFNEEAANRVAALQTTEGKLLLLFSGFQSRALGSIEVIELGLKMEEELVKRPVLSAELWSIVNMAARNLNDLEIQITAIEKGLSVSYDSESDRVRYSLVPLNTEQQLLATYDVYALSVGNDFNLVVGDDQSWYQLAQEYEITSPITARAIYSFLAGSATNSDIYSASVAALANELESAGFIRLLESIFVRLNLLDVAETSPKIQSLLASRALHRNDYRTALFIMNAMDQPKQEDQLQSWLLRRARIAIVVEDFEQSLELLNQLIDALPLNSEQKTIDRIMQVVFDLQESEQHEFAVSLFHSLYRHTSEIQARREILRWVADSYSAQDQSQDASELLIHSAKMGGNWNDSWGRSARLKAADELAVVGFYDDARIIYTELRDATLDPRIKHVINNRLRNLPQSK